MRREDANRGMNAAATLGHRSALRLRRGAARDRNPAVQGRDAGASEPGTTRSDARKPEASPDKPVLYLMPFGNSAAFP